MDKLNSKLRILIVILFAITLGVLMAYMKHEMDIRNNIDKTLKTQTQTQMHLPEEQTCSMSDFVCQNSYMTDLASRKLVRHVKKTLQKYYNDPFYATGSCPEITAEHIIALIITESNGDIWAKGKSGEIGLMQIIPKWHVKALHSAGIIPEADGKHLWSPERNVESGVYILMNIARNTQDLNVVFAKYNAGNKISVGRSYAGIINRRYNEIIN